MVTVIETKNLCKNYGLQKAVDNVDITVKAGEIYGFLGRKGLSNPEILCTYLALLEMKKIMELIILNQCGKGDIINLVVLNIIYFQKIL